MKIKLSILIIACMVLFPCVRAMACTNVIVTKGASADGSSIVSYNADSHQLYGELYYHPAASWQKGSLKKIYDWDGGAYRGEIAQVTHTYQTVGNMNEHQLIITETTFGGREELANKDGIMDYGSLIYTTLQRARTAREAIRTIDMLMQTYGYPSEGETFSIADKDECWIMEIVGKGDEKGAVWVAIRIPDGYISAHANFSRIDRIPFEDHGNCLYSEDVVSFARRKGYFSGSDAEFSFCDTYCPDDGSGVLGCETRTWSAFRMLGGENFDAERYLDFASGKNMANKMPLYILPSHKLTVTDVAAAMRDHFEDTPFDFREDVGAGPFRIPYRWRPLGFKVDGKEYEFQRSAATQQTGFWLVAQSRGWLPDEVGGLLWFGVDDSANSPLTPIYACINRVPECFKVGNGDMLHYSETSAFWLVNRVTHFTYLFYDRVYPEVKAKIDELENESLALVAEQDARAVSMVEAGNAAAAVNTLTQFSLQRAEHFFKSWESLGNYLLVKYMDGNIKKQNPDGSFMELVPGSNIPVMPSQPKYRERYLRSVARDLDGN